MSPTPAAGLGTPANGHNEQDNVVNASLRASDLCLCAALVGAPLAVGTVHPASWAVLLVLSLSGWLLALRGGATSRVSHPLVIALVVLSGLAVLLPLVPLPPAILELLSPRAAEQWALGLPGSEPTTRWGTLHRAPGPGAYAVLRWCTGVSFLLACSARAAEKHWRQKALQWILLSGALAVLLCLFQTGLKMETVLGLYQPRHGMLEPLRAPFLNENHWAGFLGLVLVLSVAELLRGQYSAGKAALLTLLAAIAGIMVLVMNSHSGTIGTASGLAVLGVLSLSRSKLWKQRPVLLSLACLVAAVPLVGAVARFLEGEASRRHTVTGLALPVMSDESRLLWLPDAWRLIKSHPWSGVGVGGFLDAFPGFRLAPGRHLAYQPEMLPVKLLSEAGLIVGGMLFVVVIAIVVSALWTASRHPGRLGAASALLALLVHEQADFATHTGGVLLPALLLLAVSLPPSAVQRTRRSHLPVVACLAVLVLLATPGLQHWDLRYDLDESGLSDGSSREDLDSAAARLWTWHPSSFVLAQELGRRYSEAAAPNQAMAWLNRAMLLAPHHPDPHLMTARLLRALGANRQALVEYRLTIEADWRYAAIPVFKEVLHSYTELNDLERVVPRNQADGMGLLAQLAIWEHHPRANVLADLAYQQDPANPRAVSVKARTLRDSGRQDEARDIAVEALGKLTMSASIRYQLLGVLWYTGERPMALEQLAALLATEHPLKPDAYLRLAQWRHALEQPALARVALRQARRGTPSTIAGSLLLEARLELEAGEHLAALGLVRRAQQQAPDLAEPWVEEVRMLAEVNQTQQAAEIARNNARKLQSSPAGRALLERFNLQPESDAPSKTGPSEQGKSSGAGTR